MKKERYKHSHHEREGKRTGNEELGDFTVQKQLERNSLALLKKRVAGIALHTGAGHMW